MTTNKPPSQGGVQHTTRGHSLPPAMSIPNSSANQQQTRGFAEELDNTTAKHSRAASRKCSYSETHDFQSSGPGHQNARARKNDSDPMLNSSSGRPSSATTGTQDSMALDIINESDEDQYERSQTMDYHKCQSTGPVIISTTSWHSSAQEAARDGLHSGISDSNDDSDVEIIKPRPKPSIQWLQQGKKSAVQKPSSKVRGGSDSDELSDTGSEYDPATCSVYTAYLLM